jgi:formamidopyrimidine-DNA glycosylase
MPELPEVEFCGRALWRWTAGRRVVEVEVHDPRTIRASRTDRPTAALEDGARALRDVVLGAPPTEPRRHGKRLLWRFGDRALLLHLGMTGKWTRGVPSFPKLSLHLDDGGVVHFSDPRLLGGVVPTTPEAGARALVDGLGPDAWRDPLPALTGRRAVKLVLMDQAVVAGLGNLHAAEALWRARLDPHTPAAALGPRDHAALAAAVHEQLHVALAMMEGDDEIRYVEESGAPNPFPLYDREGEPCPRCGAPILRTPQGGRSTWWCAGCQLGPLAG